MPETVIKVDSVSKDFRLPSERMSSLKSRVIHPFKRVHYKNQHALKSIDLDIKEGEFFGIVGRNGSGKSTLLKLLAGIYQPTKGKISVRGKLVPFIELGVGFNPELSGRENVFLNGALLGFSEKEINLMYNDIVEFAELGEFMEQKLKNYSSGMQVRLAFSMAIRAKADILLIDEVLAVGDADFQRKCFSYFKQLKKDKKTVVFVSHDMGAVEEFCDRAVLIDQSTIKKIGSTKSVTEMYSRLFLEHVAVYGKESMGQISRWGTKEVTIENINTRSTDQMVEISFEILSHADVKSVTYGLHVVAEDGRDLVATNNKLLKSPDIKDLKKGAIFKVTWSMQNVFSDGNFSISLTLVSEIDDVFDWITNASSFTVKRIQRSVTPILPPIKTSFQEKI